MAMFLAIGPCAGVAVAAVPGECALAMGLKILGFAFVRGGLGTASERECKKQRTQKSTGKRQASAVKISCHLKPLRHNDPAMSNGPWY